ncbi:hypothetical protein ACFQ2C_02645 [Sphingobacterium daejeonense]|uniref:Uncharacterized protein n=1 Tax=Sphingobacterium daejeonense TaxID=371142 RepID=A0ABW3RHB7_9SPHI
MKWKFILVTIVIIVNLPIVNKNVLLMMDGNNPFKYSNSNASFTQQESFAFKDPYLTYWSINRFIEETHPSNENKQVYRLYKINPVCFWRWSYYISISRNYKYKSWNEIEKNRVPYNQENMWQDF